MQEVKYCDSSKDLGYSSQTRILKPDVHKVQIPKEMRSLTQAWPVIHIDTHKLDLFRETEGMAHLIGDAIGATMARVYERPLRGQTLLKVHPGEPKCRTRMRPAYVAGTVRFLREHGADGIVIGDTTVAYEGARGHKQNPSGDPSQYIHLVRRNGWSRRAEFGAPFVVLDRPVTARESVFEFEREQERVEIHGIKHYRDFYVSGGFAAADSVINHAHLTLHSLAGWAGCVKSIAMGCSGVTGKLQMHKSLLPQFDPELCTCCGQCIESCPRGALQWREDELCPEVDPTMCIGCGKCEVVCAADQGAVKMRGKGITRRDRDRVTLPIRMADYTIGLMNNKWDRVVHVLHMYAITKRCDCVNSSQKPLLSRDLGFLIGKNPFAVDRLAMKIFEDALNKEGPPMNRCLARSVEAAAGYVREVYGILSEVPVGKISLS